MSVCRFGMAWTIEGFEDAAFDVDGEDKILKQFGQL